MFIKPTLFHFSEEPFSFKSLFSFFIWFIVLFFFLQKGVEKNGQKEIKKDEITQEDPQDVEYTDSVGIHRWSHWVEKYTLPVFHSKDLENGYECNGEGIVVTSGLSIDEVEEASEQAHSQEGEDDDEEEHEHGDVDEGLVGSGDDRHDGLHRLQSSQQSCNSKYSESSKHSDSPESRQVGLTWWNLLENNLENGEPNDTTIKNVHSVCKVFTNSDGIPFDEHFIDENPSEPHVTQFKEILQLLGHGGWDQRQGDSIQEYGEC